MSKPIPEDWTIEPSSARIFHDSNLTCPIYIIECDELVDLSTVIDAPAAEAALERPLCR